MTPLELYEEATALHRKVADIAYGYTTGSTYAQREHAAMLLGKLWRRALRRWKKYAVTTTLHKLYREALTLDNQLVQLLYHGTTAQRRKVDHLLDRSWRRVLRRQFPRL